MLKTGEARSIQTFPVGRISIRRLAMVLTFTAPAMTIEAALILLAVTKPFSPTVILSCPVISPSTWPSMTTGPLEEQGANDFGALGENRILLGS